VAELGADATAVNRDGKTPLQMAREEGHAEVVQALVEAAGGVAETAKAR
jgi:ankyrin repeat protein